MLQIIDLGDRKIYSGRDVKDWPDEIYQNIHSERLRHKESRFVIYKYKNFLYGIREGGSPHIEPYKVENISNNYIKVQGILL